jgi:hypothetical protein
MVNINGKQGSEEQKYMILKTHLFSTHPPADKLLNEKG